MRALLAQLAPVTHDVSANLSTACTLLDRHPEADIAVFPELYLQSYALRGIPAIDFGTSSVLVDLAKSARRNRTAVLVGAAEATTRGMANTAVCIDERGEVVDAYRKVHLFGAEPRFFEAGDGYVLARLAGIEVGVLICYDVEFPEAARANAAAGAELLVTLSANMGPYGDDHALFVKVRALENGLPHVYVNCVGEEGRLRFCGRSSVVDGAGRVLAELPGYRPEVRVVEVPIGTRARASTSPDYLADRRPDVQVRTH